MDVVLSFLNGAKEVRLGYKFNKTYTLRGIRVELGRISCSFKVPGHLLDKKGHLEPEIVVDMVDELGNACCALSLVGVLLTTIATVDMSISYPSTAKLDDELAIDAKVLGTDGNYSETVVQIKNKITGELIAEGLNTVFHQQTSKM